MSDAPHVSDPTEHPFSAEAIARHRQAVEAQIASGATALADVQALRLVIERLAALGARVVSFSAAPGILQPAVNLREATPALLDYLDHAQCPVASYPTGCLATVDGCRVFWPTRRPGTERR